MHRVPSVGADPGRRKRCAGRPVTNVVATNSGAAVNPLHTKAPSVHELHSKNIADHDSGTLERGRGISTFGSGRSRENRQACPRSPPPLRPTAYFLHTRSQWLHKVLALIGRVEVRNWIDVIECGGARYHASRIEPQKPAAPSRSPFPHSPKKACTFDLRRKYSRVFWTGAPLKRSRLTETHKHINLRLWQPASPRTSGIHD